MVERPGRIDRRRFVQLMAAGAAAAAAVPIAEVTSASEVAATDPKAISGGRRAPTRTERQEIEKQKKSLAETLGVIRDFELPAGSRPAFLFRAMRASRKR